MSSILEKLEKNRTPILLAEIGAYLHLIGRFSEEFVYAQAEDATNAEKNFDYKTVCNSSAFFECTKLDDLLKDNSWGPLLNAFKNLNNAGELSNYRIKSFSEFIEKHTWRDGPKGLCKILADAHGIVSGIDKALAGRGKAGKQKKAYTFKATAFGYEKEIELLKNAELKKILFQKIEEILDDIKNQQDISYENYFNFIHTIKEYYPKSIGETRRPINEISLYNYAHPIASLVKSNLAKIAIDGRYEVKEKSKWRILKIIIDVIGLLSKGLKIGDIFGYKNEIEETYNKIKKIVEFEYPLGNEIYRDSTGIYFSCPDVRDINSLKSEIIDKLEGLNKLDFSLQIEISEDSRSMVTLSSERENSLKKIFYSHVDHTENIEKGFEESQDVHGEDICPVCRIRLKPEREDRCEKCKERYAKRATIWLDKGKPSEGTIWLDEVADKNDRVALLVGQFDLRNWLNSEFVGTFVSQTFEEWKDICVKKVKGNCIEKVSDVCSRLNIKSTLDLNRGFKNLFDNPQSLNHDWKKICGSFTGQGTSRINSFINDFWAPIAERDATGKALTLTDNSEKAKHLIKLLFRKHPSLARIFRVWNTTQEFIDETIFDKILKEYNWNSEPRRQRIQFKIKPNPDVPKGATCDIDIDGLRFSPVCIDKENGLFMSTTNLENLKKLGDTADDISRNLNEKKIKVKTERDKTWKDQKNGEFFTIKEAKPADEKFQDYLPYIRIYDFPDQFMALVPAYDAFDIAKKIFEEYEIQFSKVRDRLPFHLGIIGFHKRAALYLAMDAGKRLIEAFKKKSRTIKARVKSVCDTQCSRLDKYVKKLTLQPDPCYSPVPLTWYISYSTGDPTQEDEWHPYIRINNNGNLNRNNYLFDYTGNGNYVVHVKELQTDDCIEIEPSFFKMLFLESASDRFRVDENLKALDDIKRLDELWDAMQNILKTKKQGIAQLYAFWQEVEKRRLDYGRNSVWEDFVKSALINILKLSPQKDSELFDKLFQATRDGLLNICLHWNLQVRKTKPEEQGV